jgi:ribosome recycling factor
MKQEHQAAPASTFKNVKEVEANARTRMDKVLTELQNEMAHIRTGRASIGSNDGKIVRVPIPPLTQERRRDLAKKLSHIAEERRVGLRNVRRDANDQLKKMLKDKLISEDDERQALDIIQKLTDAQIGKIDQAAKAKEKEILEFK